MPSEKSGTPDRAVERRKKKSPSAPKNQADGSAETDAPDSDSSGVNRSQDENWSGSLGNSGVNHDDEGDSNSTATDIRYDRDVDNPRGLVRGGGPGRRR